MTTTTTTTTALETALLNKVTEGMDNPGEGWFHEFTNSMTPTHSECAVLGSLITKGLIVSEDYDEDGFSWLTLASIHDSTPDDSYLAPTDYSDGGGM